MMERVKHKYIVSYFPMITFLFVLIRSTLFRCLHYSVETEQT